MEIEVDSLPYKIVRSVEAGVFAGHLLSESGDTITLCNARCLWYWSGAASLNQLATEGVKNPVGCKFTVEAPKIKIFGVCEILDVTPSAKANIKAVPKWER